jgi:hypothetical protein
MCMNTFLVNYQLEGPSSAYDDLNRFLLDQDDYAHALGEAWYIRTRLSGSQLAAQLLARMGATDKLAVNLVSVRPVVHNVEPEVEAWLEFNAT